MGLKEESPFTPGNPVPPELFVGRAKEINEIKDILKRTIKGKQENIFLLGDRGIGKSSIACVLTEYARKSENMISVHFFAGNIGTLDNLIVRIFEEVLNESKGQTSFIKIKEIFKNIREVGVSGLSIKFSPPTDELEQLKTQFPKSISNLLGSMPDKKGIFIVIDDINGFSSNKEFAKWYKSFVDTVAVHHIDNFPVLIMIVGYPEGRGRLYENEPSLQRIFSPIFLKALSDKEVEEFFERAFSRVNIKIEKESLETMVEFSGGLPVMMHEIGDAVFLVDKDKHISQNDAVLGVISAAKRVGQKYLEQKVYYAIRSQNYHEILKKIVDSPSEQEFTRRAIISKLSSAEKRVFDNFLQKMQELGVIEPNVSGGVGAYRFVNAIYPVYIWLQSAESKKRSSS